MIKQSLLLALLLPAFSLALEQSEITEMVATHNKWRQTTDSPALHWSTSLATTAQTYAEKLKTTQRCNQVHSHAPGLGENLFWASAMTRTATKSDGVKNITYSTQTVTPAQVTDAWGNEVSDYTYSTGACASGKKCGHYTQVVWKTTTELGCGMAVCADNTQVWVCNYTPAGNIIGQKPY